VRLQHARHALAEAGRGTEAGEFGQQRRRRAIVAALDEGGRFVGGGARVPVLAREAGQAQARASIAAAEGRIHQRARAVERERGGRKVIGGGRALHGRGQGQARARPAAPRARVAVALQERTRFRRPGGGQALRRLGQVRLAPGASDEEDGAGAHGDRKRPEDGANGDAPGVHANVRA
jgi:hypothetical protein